jgi:hypothetical protein
MTVSVMISSAFENKIACVMFGPSLSVHFVLVESTPVVNFGLYVDLFPFS